MHGCRICDYSCDDPKLAQRHERTRHRTAYFANLGTGHRYYVAPVPDLKFCAHCNIYIGNASFSHELNQLHKERVASSGGQSSLVSSGGTPVHGESLLKAASASAVSASLESWMDIPIQSRRHRQVSASLSSQVEDGGDADRGDEAGSEGDEDRDDEVLRQVI
jgi:hypothetical protein